MPSKRKHAKRTLTQLLSPAALQLLSATGPELVRQIGIEAVRRVVYDVLLSFA